MFVGDKRQETPITISIQGEAFEQVNQLVWLIVLISSDGNSKKTFKVQLEAMRTHLKMIRAWRSREITQKTKAG